MEQSIGNTGTPTPAHTAGDRRMRWHKPRPSNLEPSGSRVFRLRRGRTWTGHCNFSQAFDSAVCDPHQPRRKSGALTSLTKGDAALGELGKQVINVSAPSRLLCDGDWPGQRKVGPLGLLCPIKLPGGQP